MEYTIPVRNIKNILLREHESFVNSLRNRIYSYEYDVYMLGIANNAIQERIQTCQTYEDLEDFVHESRRMSLTEWIESL